ncbi:MAG: pirin family protein [Candidatus Nanopelagicales bacterium]
MTPDAPRQILHPREVPLGGPRAMTVRRTLPHRDIRTIGAWCFIDDYGPSTPDDPPMHVPPHPHTGLQTVTWLLAGEVEHRDSSGGTGRVLPGELNLMTAGHGIAHSEYAVGDGPWRGVQTWVALPAAAVDVEPGFAHHDDLPKVALDVEAGSAPMSATVILGSLAGATSPATVHSPIVGAELRATGAAAARVELDPSFEYGLLALDPGCRVAGEPLDSGALLYLDPGHDSVDLDTDRAAALLLVGGEPLDEELVMWWNFVGRSHNEIAAARAAWEAGERFGEVVGDVNTPLPAPALPNAILQPRPGRR